MKKKNLFFFIWGHEKIKHDNNRFKISLLKKKFNVKFIVFFNQFRNINNKIKKKDYFFFNNLKDFYLLLKNNNKVSYILDFIPNNYKFINFKKKLIKNEKLYFIKYETGLIPEDNKRFSFLYKIKNKITNSNFLFKNYLYLVTGLKSYYINKNLRSIPTWSCDYNEYLNYISSANYKKKENQTKYSVFIDEMIPNHPDIELLKLKKISTIKEYYKNIGNFLSTLEIILDHKIKILLHPLVKRNFYPKKFKVIQNKTCCEIANCKNVFLHGSTSVSYAVLFKKNIVYLTDKKLLWMEKRIKYFHSYTGGQILNMSLKVNKKKFLENLKFNKENYLNYVDNFIKHPKAKLSFDKIIMNVENFT